MRTRNRTTRRSLGPTQADSARWARATKHDGATPAELVHSAAHGGYGGSEERAYKAVRGGIGRVGGREDVDTLPVEELFGTRAVTCLRRAGVATVGELTKRTGRDLLKVRGWGRKTLLEIRDVLAELGLRLADAPEDRVALVAAVSEAGKRWWSAARTKANHGCMSRAELDLFNAISDLKTYDGEDVR